MSLLSSQTQRRTTASHPDLIPTPQQPSTPAYYEPGSVAVERKSFPIKASTLLIITLVIIILIVVITWILISRITRDSLEQVYEPEIIDLDALIDLRVDGQCCITTTNPNPNPRWIYSPSHNFSFSIDKTTPSVVCQGQVGQALTDCLAFVSNPDGSPKIIAHQDTVSYYGFSSGTPGAVCSSLGTCP